MPRGIKRQLRAATKAVNADIARFAQEGHIAAGLSGEGYNGGYRDALYDVELALNGITPDKQWWVTTPQTKPDSG